MFKKLICSIALAALLVMSSSVQALTITTEDGNGADAYLANDSQQGPDTTTGAEVRMRAFRQLADTRSKTGYIRFDLSEAAGDLSGATLTFEATFLKGGEKGVEVYGLIDGGHDAWNESTITYNNAPGMIPNPPTTLGNYAFDTTQVTLLGTISTPAAGDPYPVRFSSDPTALPLTAFLRADTNGLVTFIFIGTNNEGEIASKEHETFIPPTLTLPNVSEGPATDPNPANGAKGVSTDVVLSWKTGVDPADPNVPNPNIKEHYLWLSKAYDPANPPGGPDWNDPAVRQYTIGADTNPADGSVDPTASKTLDIVLQRDALYYWVVDQGLTDSSGPLETDPAKIILSSTWSFETITSGPEVDAGSSIVTWLEEGATTVDLNGGVTDVTGDVTAILWSVVESPAGSNVAIANPLAAVTTATLDATGRYVLELYATDAAQNEDSDQMSIDVYADNCAAAKNNPNGYVAPLYDFDDDCRVDFTDFVMFAAEWLQDESLMEDALYDPDAAP